MNFVNLNSSELRFLLIGLLSLAFLVLAMRAIIFFHREQRNIYPVYPPTWNPAQCRALEVFRLLIGLALVLLWATFFYCAPSMRTDWVSGHLELFFFMLLLWISDAWVLLLIPRNWQKFGTISHSFWITMTFLIVWWSTVFTATEWMLVKASTMPRGLSGPYAEQSAHLRG